MDWKNYKIKLTVRAMCLFEQMKNKSFFECDEEDALFVMYVAFIANNDLCMTYKVFLNMLEDKKVLGWIQRELEKYNKYNDQFNQAVSEIKESSDEVVFISQLAAQLIVSYGLPPDYVMNQMELWEFKEYFKAAEHRKKEQLTEQRLWTYLTILPQVDGKKMKSPEKLIQFPWETDKQKKSALEDLNSKSEQIMNFFEKQNNDESI